MSDPVTNVEIEDVLSSIRRLVSDGDKARTRDPAPRAPDVEQAPDAPKPAAESATPEGESKTDKFVLTPAFMVVDNDVAPSGAEADESDEGAAVEAVVAHAEVELDEHADDSADEDAGWVEEIAADAGRDAIEQGAGADQADGAPMDALRLDNAIQDAVDNVVSDHIQTEADDILKPSHTTNDDVFGDEAADDMVWGSVEDAREAGMAAVPEDDMDLAAEPAKPNRSDLVATIAELEAAVSDGAEDFEPDGSEMMGETIAWPGAAPRNLDAIDDAQETDLRDMAADMGPEMDLAAEDLAANIVEETASASDLDAPQEAATSEELEPVVAFEHRTADTDHADHDDYGDDDLDGLMDAGALSIDEDALREMVSDVVRQELSGALGERITRNVRKLVRREIYRILSSQEFD